MEIEHARNRVDEAYGMLKAKVPAEIIRGAKVLDIGCGSGNGVVAALKLGARFAVGIDRDPEEFGEPHFEQMAKEYGVDTRCASLIAADVFSTKFFDGGFDLAIMYDSAEHVPSPAAFIDFMARSLRPGGHGLVVTCPLYYGPVGHHLWQFFPDATAPWAHLYYDWPQRLEAANVGPRHTQWFGELNKVTHRQLLNYIEAAGMSLVADTSVYNPRFPPMLEQFGHLIDMSKVPDREVLLCDYTSLLFRK